MHLQQLGSLRVLSLFVLSCTKIVQGAPLPKGTTTPSTAHNEQPAPPQAAAVPPHHAPVQSVFRTPLNANARPFHPSSQSSSHPHGAGPSRSHSGPPRSPSVNPSTAPRPTNPTPRAQSPTSDTSSSSSGSPSRAGTPTPQRNRTPTQHPVPRRIPPAPVPERSVLDPTSARFASFANIVASGRASAQSRARQSTLQRDARAGRPLSPHAEPYHGAQARARAWVERDAQHSMSVLPHQNGRMGSPPAARRFGLLSGPAHEGQGSQRSGRTSTRAQETGAGISTDSERRAASQLGVERRVRELSLGTGSDSGRSGGSGSSGTTSTSGAEGLHD